MANLALQFLLQAMCLYNEPYMHISHVPLYNPAVFVLCKARRGISITNLKMVPDIIFPFDSSELMHLIVCRPEWKVVNACYLFHCLVTTTLHVAPESQHMFTGSLLVVYW